MLFGDFLRWIEVKTPKPPQPLAKIIDRRDGILLLYRVEGQIGWESKAETGIFV
jgi:hypothetical protein